MFHDKMLKPETCAGKTKLENRSKPVLEMKNRAHRPLLSSILGTQATTKSAKQPVLNNDGSIIKKRIKLLECTMSKVEEIKKTLSHHKNVEESSSIALNHLESQIKSLRAKSTGLRGRSQGNRPSDSLFLDKLSTHEEHEPELFQNLHKIRPEPLAISNSLKSPRRNDEARQRLCEVKLLQMLNTAKSILKKSQRASQIQEFQKTKQPNEPHEAKPHRKVIKTEFPPGALENKTLPKLEESMPSKKQRASTIPPKLKSSNDQNGSMVQPIKSRASLEFSAEENVHQPSTSFPDRTKNVFAERQTPPSTNRNHEIQRHEEVMFADACKVDQKVNNDVSSHFLTGSSALNYQQNSGQLQHYQQNSRQLQHYQQNSRQLQHYQQNSRQLQHYQQNSGQQQQTDFINNPSQCVDMDKNHTQWYSEAMINMSLQNRYGNYQQNRSLQHSNFNYGPSPSLEMSKTNPQWYAESVNNNQSLSNRCAIVTPCSIVVIPHAALFQHSNQPSLYGGNSYLDSPQSHSSWFSELPPSFLQLTEPPLQSPQFPTPSSLQPTQSLLSPLPQFTQPPPQILQDKSHPPQISELCKQPPPMLSQQFSPAQSLKPSLPCSQNLPPFSQPPLPESPPLMPPPPPSSPPPSTPPPPLSLPPSLSQSPLPKSSSPFSPLGQITPKSMATESSLSLWSPKEQLSLLSPQSPTSQSSLFSPNGQIAPPSILSPQSPDSQSSLESTDSSTLHRSLSPGLSFSKMSELLSPSPESRSVLQSPLSTLSRPSSLPPEEKCAKPQPLMSIKIDRGLLKRAIEVKQNDRRNQLNFCRGLFYNTCDCSLSLHSTSTISRKKKRF